MSSKNSIQVALKVRPLLPKERDLSSCWRVVNNSIQLIDGQSDPYYFDYIFDQGASNYDIFDKMAKHIVHSGVKGFNGTIFAYGQTSSGKTYTMMGNEKNPGVMVLAAKEVFKQIESTTDRQFLLRVAYIEIYNEKIYDLLNKKNHDLKIHESTTGNVTVNCDEVIITCEDDLLRYLCLGNKERTVGETNMNERSSRSHAIFRIIIESQKVDRNEDAIIQSVLNLVDLAGSERADQTGSSGARLKEGGHINKSLLFLSTVIKRLSENEEFINYRDSKLTRILQASLGGNALTSIICTIKPTAVEETQSTLNFAMCAKTIKNKPQVNEIVSDATMLKRQERQIKYLTNQLEEERKKNQNQAYLKNLEKQLDFENLKIITHNSLHNISILQQKGKRRRTWCLATSSLDTVPAELSAKSSTQGSAVATRIPVISQYCTPLITLRETDNKKSNGSIAQPAVKDEPSDFVPAENFQFPSPPKTGNEGQTKESQVFRASLTPKAENNMASYIKELEQFVNFEKELGVKHEYYQALEEQVKLLEERNALLESEHSDFLALKLDHDLVKQELDEKEQRRKDLQAQVNGLSAEVTELKETVEKLRIENRDAVNLEFEFESHKLKAKSRENELLDVLGERDKDIHELRTSLNALQQEAELAQRDRNQSIFLPIPPKQNDCTKCKDLEHIAEKNTELKDQLDKLLYDKERLQLKWTLAVEDVASVQAKLLDDVSRTEKLKLEIEVIREKYETVKLELEAQRSVNIEQCEQLNKTVDSVRNEMRILQGENEELKSQWTQQQDAFAKIQVDYDEVQQRYQSLQVEYKKLEDTSLEKRVLLEERNESLLTEIGALKARLEREQTELLALQCNEGQSDGEALGSQLTELQKEYDDLSNQLMDNLQEGEACKKLCRELEEKCAEYEEYVTKQRIKFEETEKYLQDQICDLKSQLDCGRPTRERGSDASSGVTSDLLRSSGVYVDEDETSNALIKSGIVNTGDLPKFVELVDDLHEIEMVYVTGKSRTFKAAEEDRKGSTPSKLLIETTDAITLQEVQPSEDDNEDSLRVRLSGVFQRNMFRILALQEDPLGSAEELQPYKEDVAQLHQRIAQLQASNEYLCKEKASLLESTQKSMNELREQVTGLSMALLEKSLVIEKCTCEELQRTIADLERERAELTLTCDELQSAQDSFHNAANSTLNAMQRGSKPCNEKTELLHQLEEAKSRYLTAEASIATIREEYEGKMSDLEKRLQLDLLQKLELSRAEFRENIRKYNQEWEESRQAFEAEVKSLQNQLAQQQNECQCVELRKELQVVSKEQAILQEKARECESKLQAKTDELREKEERLAELRKMEALVPDLENRQAELSDERSKLQANIVKLEYERSQIDEERQSLLTEKAALAVSIEQLKEEIASSNLACETLAKDKTELTDKVKSLTDKNVKTETELSEIAESYGRDKELLKSLQNKFDALLVEKRKFNEEIHGLQAEHASKLESLAVEKVSLEDSLKQYESVVRKKEESEETLRLKIESLTKDLKETQDRITALREISNDYEDLKKMYALAKAENVDITEKLKTLEAEISKQEDMQKVRKDIESGQQLEIENLKLHLQHAKEENKALLETQSALQLQIERIESRIVDEKDQLQHKCMDLHGIISELKLKCDSLEKTNTQLEQSKVELHQKLMELQATSEQFETLQASVAHYKHSAEGHAEECKQMRLMLEGKERAFQDIRLELESKLLLLSSLLSEKKVLEDKLYATEVLVKTLESELAAHKRSESTNTSIESNLSGSPQSRRSKEFAKTEDAVLVKRKNRRLSTHDENRRQLSWGATRDIATLTDPADTSCNCSELDLKLKECEKNLFIRESQVSVLNKELKNHPLKTENAALIKRLQEAQDRHRLEIMKYKRALQEQTCKPPPPVVNKLHKATGTVDCVTATAKTQTESELEESLQKLQSKYNDLKGLCRLRFNVIKELEHKLEQQKENENRNSVNTTSELKTLKLLSTDIKQEKKS